MHYCIDDVITESRSGGKWTTYRSMAEQTVDKAVEKFNLNTTKGSLLVPLAPPSSLLLPPLHLI